MPESRDYNGTGRWTAAAVQARYALHARSLGVQEPRSLAPPVHGEGDVVWTYPVMDQVIQGIEEADPACVEIGVEFIEDGQRQPFGRLLQAKTARALRRAPLTAGQRERLRSKILGMLVAAVIPREFREYAKLLRRIGVGPGWTELRGGVDEGNPHVMRYVRYFERHVRRKSPS